MQDLLDPRRNFSEQVEATPLYSRFHLQAVLAVNAIDPTEDYARYLVPLLSDQDSGVRADAVMGARNFQPGRVNRALLAAVIERVRRDGDPLVRKRAADAALDLGYAVPPRLDAHPELLPLIAAPATGKNSPQDFKRFARAAQRIKWLIAMRNR